MKDIFRKLAAAFVGLAVLSASTGARAGSVLGVTVSKLHVIASGTQALVTVNGTIATKDACHTSALEGFVFAVNTDEGKAMLSTLIAAKLSDKQVQFYGTAGNNCTTVTLSAGPLTLPQTMEILGQVTLM